MALDLDKIRNSYGAFYIAMNPGFGWVDYQQEQIVPKLEQIVRGEIDRLMIFLPAGHAKSDLATRNLIPYYMGHHPTENAMCLSYGASLASDDFGGKIKEKMSSPLYCALFPRSKISMDSRSKNLFRTQEGGTFFSEGFGGGIAGKRVNLMVLDDLIKNDEEADSETTQNGLFSTYTNVVKKRLRPKGKIVLCMHRWRIRDIAGRILEAEGTVDKGGDWTVLKIQAEPEPGKFLWESYYGRKRYLDAKRFDDSWNAMEQQEPLASKSFNFKKEWLCYYDVPPAQGKFNTYMLVDPAKSKERSSDRTCILVFAAGPNKRLFLVDMVLDRLHPGERMTAILSRCRKWEPQQLIYEELGLTSDTYYIQQEMEKEDFPPSMYPIGVGRKGPRHMLSKEQRIDLITTLFADRKIWLPRTFITTLSDGSVVDLIKYFVDEEYTLYKGKGSVKHDDVLDCFSRLLEPELTIEYAENPAATDEEDYTPEHPQGVTWESQW